MSELHEQARENRDAMTARGELYRRPNGEFGTVLKCPWPGCGRDAVEGWSSCSGHFSQMREAGKMARPVPSEQQLGRAEEVIATMVAAPMSPDARRDLARAIYQAMADDPSA